MASRKTRSTLFWPSRPAPTIRAQATQRGPRCSSQRISEAAPGAAGRVAGGDADDDLLMDGERALGGARHRLLLLLAAAEGEQQQGGDAREDHG